MILPIWRHGDHDRLIYVHFFGDGG